MSKILYNIGKFVPEKFGGGKMSGEIRAKGLLAILPVREIRKSYEKKLFFYRSLALRSLSQSSWMRRMRYGQQLESPAKFFEKFKEQDGWQELLSREVIMDQFSHVVDNMNDEAEWQGPISEIWMYCAEHAVTIATMIRKLCPEVKCELHFGVAVKDARVYSHFWVIVGDELIDDSHIHGQYHRHRSLCRCLDPLGEDLVWTRR